MATGGLALSKEFFELLKAIGESKSKQEEDRIVTKEVQRLKQKLETSKTSAANAPTDLLLSSKKRAKEFLVRLLYVEMLGHDASFGYIKAVEMAASASLYHKRTGYLVCAACLSPEHEFRFMLVNQMQRDLQSANVLEVCGGILATTNLISGDMVPAVSGEVTKLLNHDSATVRKKAIIALYRFHHLAPEIVTDEEMCEHLRKTLCDKDPAVMGSSLNVINQMARIQPQPFKDLVPSLVSILKQICDHRLRLPPRPGTLDAAFAGPDPRFIGQGRRLDVVGDVRDSQGHHEQGRYRHQRRVRDLLRVRPDHRHHLPQSGSPRCSGRRHQSGMFVR